MNILDMIKQLYAVEQPDGYERDDMEKVKQLFGALPVVLEEFWSTAGRTQQLHDVQDRWIRPQDFLKEDRLKNSAYLMLINENQGCCQAGIRRDDLMQADPPVYVTMDQKKWTQCTGTLSEFLCAALAYEAVFAFAYQADDFVRWLTEDELKVIRSGLEKRRMNFMAGLVWI